MGRSVPKAGADGSELRPISQERIVFGRVIAQREYRVGRTKLLLQIGTPHIASWRTDFYCPFRLVGPRETKVFRTFGIDALQALMLAFDLMKVILEGKSPRISWLAGEGPGDVGIYRRLTSGQGTAFDRRIERMFDKALLERVRKLRRLAIRQAGPRNRRS